MQLLGRKGAEPTTPRCLVDRVDSHSNLSPVAGNKTNDRMAIVDEMVRSHRSALLLRPKLAQDLERRALDLATQRFCQETCFMPAGRVRLNRWQVVGETSDDAIEPMDGVDVDALYLQRCTVTNSQYQLFVDQGGYQTGSLWHATVWPRVKEFVDQTGVIGPRFWHQGRHRAALGDHPVVGVSWFEAEAYSRWIGMRLPTDAEWVRAACTPFETDGTIVQRKYPWGESFAPERANLWSSRIGHTLAADSLAEGDSVSGARQMVGNVWEWTSSNLQLWNGTALIELTEPMKSLRGGAFDSYLDNRATCQCRSADSPLARRHNIGFRCAVSACDIVNAVNERDEASASQDKSEDAR